MRLLTIIVVSYNTQQMTLACLKSIYEQTHNIDFNVMVVDNNSSDNSAALIKQQCPQVELIALKENIGFAKANNLAASQVDSKYLLLLNPDTIVLDQAIEKLINFAEQNPEAGIWGGKTLFADRSLNPTSCWQKMTVWSLFCRALHLTTLFPGSPLFNPEGYGNWQRDTVRKVDIVTGCFFLIYAELWQRLNGFDNDFVMYGEEADLCLRAKSLGYSPMITPEAVIVHYGGASERSRAGKLIKLFAAKALLIKKHWHRLTIPVGIGLLMLTVMNKIILLSLITFIKRNADYQELLTTWREVWRQRKLWSAGHFNLT